MATTLPSSAELLQQVQQALNRGADSAAVIGIKVSTQELQAKVNSEIHQSLKEMLSRRIEIENGAVRYANLNTLEMPTIQSISADAAGNPVVHWTSRFRAAIKVKGRFKGVFFEATPDARISLSGTTTLSLRLGDDLQSAFTSSTSMNCDVEKVIVPVKVLGKKVAEIGVTHLAGPTIEHAVNAHVASALDPHINTALNQHWAQHVADRVRSEVNARFVPTALDAHNTILPNVQNVQYSHLQMQNQNLQLNVRVQAAPVVVHNDLLSAVAPQQQLRAVPFTQSSIPFVDASVFNAPTFVGVDGLQALLDETLPAMEYSTTQAGHQVSGSVKRVLLTNLSPGQVDALVDFEVGVSGAVFDRQFDAAFDASSGLRFDAQSGTVFLMNPDVDISGALQAGSEDDVLALGFELSADILDTVAHEPARRLLHSVANNQGLPVQSKLSEAIRESFDLVVAKLQGAFIKTGLRDARVRMIELVNQGLKADLQLQLDPITAELAL